jgi:hypothetical protein
MNLQEMLSGLGSSDALNQAAGRAGISPDQAQGAIHGVLEHVTNGGAPEDAAEAVAAKVGISPDQVQAFMPQIMSLLRGHAEGASGETQGALGGLMGMLGGFLGGGPRQA